MIWMGGTTRRYETPGSSCASTRVRVCWLARSGCRLPLSRAAVDGRPCCCFSSPLNAPQHIMVAGDDSVLPRVRAFLEEQGRMK